MIVHVKLFARARDLVGTSSLVIELPSDATVGMVRHRLVTSYPQLDSFASSLLIAVDGQYAVAEARLTPGCEVACFPPVSGG